MLDPRHHFWGLIVCFVIATAALGFGLFAQVVWHMRPCPWCTLQRLIFAALAISSLFGVLVSLFDSRLGSSRYRSIPLVRLGFSGLVIALALAGVAAASWQSFGPIDAAGCSLTLADRIVQSTTLDVRLPLIFSATANCDEANVPLLGIPFAVWSMLTFAMIALITMIASASSWIRKVSG
jgi:disulfide bond formation protein DsbB